MFAVLRRGVFWISWKLILPGILLVNLSIPFSTSPSASITIGIVFCLHTPYLGDLYFHVFTLGQFFCPTYQSVLFRRYIWSCQLAILLLSLLLLYIIQIKLKRNFFVAVFISPLIFRTGHKNHKSCRQRTV